MFKFQTLSSLKGPVASELSWLVYSADKLQLQVHPLLLLSQIAGYAPIYVFMSEIPEIVLEKFRNL